MKKLLIVVVFLTSVLFAGQDSTKDSNIKNKNIEKQLEKEKKFAKEQSFYKGSDYDLKGAEVNMESVRNLPDVEDTNEGFNMDDVYD